MKLIVTAFGDGSLLRQSSRNEDFVSICVKSIQFTTTPRGLVKSERTGFISMQKDIAKNLISEYGLKLGEDLNKIYAKLGLAEHAIRVQESLEPQYDGHQPKINPRTNALVQTKDGRNIYYNTVVVPVKGSEDILASSAMEMAEEIQESGDLA